MLSTALNHHTVVFWIHITPLWNWWRSTLYFFSQTLRVSFDLLTVLVNETRSSTYFLSSYCNWDIYIIIITCDFMHSYMLYLLYIVYYIFCTHMVLCVDFCRPPRHPNKYQIKRIVGLAGDIIQYVKIILIQRKKGWEAWTFSSLFLLGWGRVIF